VKIINSSFFEKPYMVKAHVFEWMECFSL